MSTLLLLDVDSVSARASAGGRAAALVLLLVTCFAPVEAQDGQTGPADGLAPQHELLARLAGDFHLTTSFWASPDAEPDVSELPARRQLLLDGRVLETKVGPDSGGFLGAGLMGWDSLRGNYWYTWADTSATGVSMLRGTLGEDGAGTLEGETPTPYGYVELRVEIRYEGTTEIHDYWVPAEGRPEHRLIEHRYVPAEP